MSILEIYADYNVNTIKLNGLTQEQGIAEAKKRYRENMFIDTVVLYDSNNKELYRIEV